MEDLKRPPGPAPSARIFNLAVAALVFSCQLLFGVWRLSTALASASPRLADGVVGVALVGSAALYLSGIYIAYRSGSHFQETRQALFGAVLMTLSAGVLLLGAKLGH